MPVADHKTFCQMLDNALAKNFAYPAINCTSPQTINGTLKAFAEMKCDGIIQFSTGAGEFASGLAVKDKVLGVITLAEYVHRVADRYNINVALHTDHCQAKNIDDFLIPLIEETERRRAAGQSNLFAGHMFDGSALPLNDNMDKAVELLKRCAKAEIILEVEAGVVGGEEDGAAGSDDTPAEKLYTTTDDMVEVYRRLKSVDGGKYMFAATFGNVHGSYKPGIVKLRPEILKEGQDAVVKEFGENEKFWLVFHGGSGSSQEDIQETLGYGVVKMNVDTDTQYAFTRPIADHIIKNYAGVLKVDGEVGNKKLYDPRNYLKQAEQGICDRVKQAITDLKGEGTTLCAG